MTDFATTLAHLKTLAPVALISAGPLGVLVAPTNPYFLAGTPSQAFAAAPRDLAAGLGYGEMAPLDPKPLFNKGGCGFLQHALLTGGVDYDQPQWNLTTLMATWLEGGEGLAHKLGNLHIGYDRDSTASLWARKRMERTSRGLGWPSCGAVQAAGSKHCAGCQHFGKIKSPLNLTRPIAPVVGPSVSQPAGSGGSPLGITATVTTAAGVPITLPYSFLLDSQGYICKQEPPTPTAPGNIVRVFSCKLSDAYASKTGKDNLLHFVTTVDKGCTQEVALTLGLIQGGGTNLLVALGEKGVKVFTAGEKYVKEFLMAFLTKLHDAQASLVSLPFGWWCSADPALPKTAGDRHGFVYGGNLYKDVGTVHRSGLGDARLRDNFQPCGSIEPWLTACKMITDQKRPELDCILAASFAAPLMVVTGKNSVLVSAHGTSGTGKSTALEVGLAVWGHVRLTKEVQQSTSRSVLQKMGETRNLPLYWDEISETAVQEHVFNTYFASTHGVGASRLNSKIEYQARPEWQTMMICCANISFTDYVVAKLKTSRGGLYRVLEFPVPDKDFVFGVGRAPGQMDQLTAARMITELEKNYGVMGERYARMLGRNPGAVDAFVLKTCNEFEKSVKATNAERYWVAACGTIIAGAALANSMGATLDLPALRKFLTGVYQQNRADMLEAGVEGGTTDHTMEALAGFFKKYLNETLWTDSFPSGKGRPEPITFISGPPTNYPHPIQIHWAVKARVLRICRREFLKYLADNKIPPRQVIEGLKDHFGATTAKAKIAAGTSYQCIQEALLCIPVDPGSPLEDQMLAHSVPQLPAPAPPETQVPTGLLEGAEQAAKDLALVKGQTP